MTRSLLVLATIFSSGAVLLQKRPFLTPGLQPPDDTVARRSALRSSTHQKVWEMGMTSWASDTRGLLREQSHSSSQVQKKRHLEKQYCGKPGREIWATTASHGAFLLSNRTTALLRTVPQMAYFFFFLEVLNLEDLNQRRSLTDARERKHKLNQMAFTRPCKCRCCNWCTEAEPSHDSWVFSPSPHHRQLLQKELCFLWSIYTFSQQYTLLLSQATTCQITRGIALLFTTLLDSPVKERFQIWRQLAQDSYFTLQYFNKVATSWCNILLQF